MTITECLGHIRAGAHRSTPTETNAAQVEGRVESPSRRRSASIASDARRVASAVVTPGASRAA